MICMIFVLAFPGSPRIKAIPIILFFCYIMVIKAISFRSIKNHLHILGMFLFLGYALLSKRWALYPQAISEQSNNILWSVLLSTAISTYVIFRELSIKDVATRLVPIALLFCMNVLLKGAFIDNRLSIGINENTFGRLTCGMACIFLACSKREHWQNLLMDMLTIVFGLLTFLSGSRTSVLMLAIFTLGLLVFEHPTKDVTKLFGRIVIIALLCVAGYFCLTHIPFFYRTIGNRLETMLLALAGLSRGDGSFITRSRMTEAAKAFFLQRPFLGIGLNNFKYATYFNTYAHNNYSELAACLGVAGLIIYYTPFLIYTKRAFSQWKKGIPGMIIPLAFFVAFFAGDIGSVSYFNIITHVFVGLAVGLLSTDGTQQKTHKEM